MSSFVPNKQHLREVMLNYLIAIKSAAGIQRFVLDICGEHAPSNTTSKEWSRRIKNDHFDKHDKECICWDQMGVIYYALLQPYA